VSHEPYLSRLATEDHFFFSSFFLFVEVFIPFPDTKVVIVRRNDTHITTVSIQEAFPNYFTEQVYLRDREGKRGPANGPHGHRVFSPLSPPRPPPSPRAGICSGSFVPLAFHETLSV